VPKRSNRTSSGNAAKRGKQKRAAALAVSPRPTAPSIYKYVAASDFNRVFGESDRVTLKCSYPKDFNDPYELFLTVDFRDRPEVLAFYSEVVGDLPQLPTTCFSRSPIVMPMWAHYAQTLQGFAIEFDETLVAQSFPGSGFGNVGYQNNPSKDLAELLYRAYEIGKPRYLYMLRESVFSSAYYTKAAYWEYEMERRMICHKSDVRESGGAMLLDTPVSAVTALICGPRATPETVAAVQAKATTIGRPYFQVKIGRSSATPYLLDLAGRTFTFDGVSMKLSPWNCLSCREPLATDGEQCSWCQIDDSHRIDAADRNVFRMLDHYGLLDEYIRDMNEIGRRRRE
jgi:hypothetical protein